jgi:hypothetical protein
VVEDWETTEVAGLDEEDEIEAVGAARRREKGIVEDAEEAVSPICLWRSCVGGAPRSARGATVLDRDIILQTSIEERGEESWTATKQLKELGEEEERERHM